MTKQEIKRRYYERNRERCLERSKLWRQNNRERYNQFFKERRIKHGDAHKKRARGYALKAQYGITLEQYDEILLAQGGGCAICGKTPEENKRSLAVDHAHSGPKAGEIRGILCTYCNHRLVGRHTDGTLLRKIADYLEKGTGLFVPSDKIKPKRRRKRHKKD